MDIKPVNRRQRGNRFCGPAVVSALTGMDTDQASRLIREVTGKRSVMGTSSVELLLALHRVSICSVRREVWDNKITLAAWLGRSARPAGKVFLISAGRHWQLVSGRRYVCGQTVEIVSVKDERVKRRARVKEVWELSEYAA